MIKIADGDIVHFKRIKSNVIMINTIHKKTL